MKRIVRLLLCPLALLATALLLLSAPALLASPDETLPGTQEPSRTLLRIWVTGAPGGGQAWLKAQLKTWEKQHRGVMTYLRQVSAEEVTADDAVLPDLVLYLPGDLTAPEATFSALSGNLEVQESLLRAGRWQGVQYGLPLCWGAWVLAVDSALEPGSAVTPVPTTLLGRPATTSAPAPEAEEGYPLENAAKAEVPLLSPGGCALFALRPLLSAGQPPLTEDFAHLSAAEVYSRFIARRCATAMLTTGQATALNALTMAGKGFAFRIITPEEIITDQVWMASIPQGAHREEAAALLAYLTATDAQRALSQQGLHTVRTDLRLYADGFSGAVERSAARGLTVPNAYQSTESVNNAAWRFFQGTDNLDEALLPLL